MDSKSIERHFRQPLEKEFFQPKYKEALDGLPLWHWCLVLSLIKGDGTMSFKQFIDGNKFFRVIEKARTFIEHHSDPGSRPELLDYLRTTIEDQRDLFGPEEVSEIQSGYAFCLDRPAYAIMKDMAYRLAHGIISRDEFDAWVTQWHYTDDAEREYNKYRAERGEHQAWVERKRQSIIAVIEESKARYPTVAPDPERERVHKSLHEVMAKIEAEEERGGSGH